MEETACIGSGCCGVNAPLGMDLTFHFFAKEKKSSTKRKSSLKQVRFAATFRLIGC